MNNDPMLDPVSYRNFRRTLESLRDHAAVKAEDHRVASHGGALVLETFRDAYSIVLELLDIHTHTVEQSKNRGNL